MVVIAIDQLSKLWIVHHFAEYERLHLLPVLDITLWYNKGAAFSFLGEASGWQRWLFSGLAFVVGAGLLIWMRRLKGRTGETGFREEVGTGRQFEGKSRTFSAPWVGHGRTRTLQTTA